MGSTHILCRARGSAIDAPAEDIQLFPPGEHSITATGKDGAPVAVTVRIDAETAATLEAVRAGYAEAVTLNQGDAPYIDFNHEDGGAAGWVTAIRWAGEDPQTGGVRAAIEWSSAGREAIEGKTFRRFSPSFYAEAGRVTGAPVNMGGLVNRAAFQTIEPLFAKGGAPEPESKTNTMTEEEIAQLKAELEALKAENEGLKKLAEAAAKDKAEGQVEAAAREGRIPGAPENKARWMQALLASPATAELLASLPPNDALKPALTIQAGAAPDANAPAAILAKYKTMPNGKERDDFRRANAQAILAATRMP